MAWRERLDLRRERSKTYEDDANPRRKMWSGSLACLHYEDEAGQMQPVDMRPERVDTPAFDGYRVTAAGWHYALATGGDLQGWVGFGGKRGRHWLKFRLARVGYMHGPTRTFTNLGGAPDYDRANLSYAPQSTTIGPDGEELFVSAVAEWHNLWTTPGGGEISVQWRVDGDRLKEDVIINQAGREWLAANRPPTTPASQTWFGFVFQVDWSDVPRIVRRGIVQDRKADWTADADGVELRDAADELLAFMPLDYVYVEGEDGGRTSVPLTRRFWKDADGNHYLLVGAKVGEIAALPPGDLHFDPTINQSVGAAADDGYIEPSQGLNPNGTTYLWLGYFFGDTYSVFTRFTGISGLGGATVTTAYFSADTGAASSILSNIRAAREEAPATIASVADWNSRTQTTAVVAWDDTVAAGVNNSPSIVSVIQELADNFDPSAVLLLWTPDGMSNYAQFTPYEHATRPAPALYIEYEEGGGPEPVTVNAALGSLTLTGQDATISAPAPPVTVNASAGSLTLAGLQATVSAPPPPTTVNAAAGALTLAGQTATITLGAVSTAADAGALTLTGQQASVVPGAVSVAAAAGSLTLTGQTATITAGEATIAASAGSLTLAGQQATVTTGAVSIAANVGALTLAGQQATVTLGAVSTAADVGALTLTGQSATITTGAVSIAAAAGTLTLTGHTAAVTTGTVVQAQAGSLTLEGQQAVIVPGAATVAASTAALTLTGHQATVTTDAPPVTVNAAAGTLTLTGNAATITVGAVTVQAQAGSLALTGNRAAIVPGAVLVEAATALLQIAGQPATIDATLTVAAALAQLTLAGQQASIVTGPTTINANPGALVLTGRRATIYEAIPHGEVYVVFTAAAPLAAFTASAPSVSVASRAPSVRFDEEV